MISTIINSLLLVSATFYLVQAYRVDLQMMQQNTYRNNRYFQWWRTNKDYASISRISDLAILLLLISLFSKGITASIAIIYFSIKSVYLLKKKYKKPLAMTRRVWRLFTAMLVFSLIACIVVIIFLPHTPEMALFIASVVITTMSVLSWVVIAVSNYTMKPVESSINKMYYNDAQRLLAQMSDMKIIGITGSYGKTSTKHYLNRILCEQFNVLMTPGSFNTPMGVIRTIREHMKPYNEVFICEMGAKQIGDIKEICDLVHPTIGIITAVGEQHLESFKSIENVQRTKFELVDALPNDGFSVLNDDFEFVANREVDNVTAIRYAIRNTTNAEYTASDIEYTEFGTKFTINGNGKSLALSTKLVGECNISNLMAAVIVAMKLGVDEEKIKYAVSQIKQVEHRLNMKRTAGGVTIIDDAFNSNPDGSKMALDVLSRMTKGKRIVVTPGMIELGERQAALNEEFGKYIAKMVDVAIVVGLYNRDAIVAGIKKENNNNVVNMIVVDSFEEAQQKLATILQSGDTVLYENDLPDTFK